MRLHRPGLPFLIGLSLSLLACGDDDGGVPDSGTPPDAGPRPDAGPLPDGAPFPPTPAHFRYGANLGHPNAAWGDDVHATLAAGAGVRSLRVKLPAAHLERWGDAIEVGDLEAYADLGMHSHVGYLTGAATAEQSLMPAGEPDWKLEWYPPRNLHEPIFLPGGAVNPDNFWADYIFRVVSTYHPWIRVWHVWNEPDWVADWQVTLTWDTEPPAAADLPRWNGSIFDYIRMLRITKEVALTVDPGALVATGGLGYDAFLDAILRYTDHPVDGSVDADHPVTGGAYVDVMDVHYYPVFGAESSDAGLDGFLAHVDGFAARLDAHGVTVQGWNASEVGAPLEALGGYPGGPDYARNFLLKVMTAPQATGFGGIDWFILSNSDGDDPWSRMGLYQDLSSLASTDDAVMTGLGTAYRTLVDTLGEATADPTATAALDLPLGARGVAFATAEGGRILVLWATTPADSETASATATLPAPDGADVIVWDGTVTDLDAAGGEVSVELTGAPVLVRIH